MQTPSPSQPLSSGTSRASLPPLVVGGLVVLGFLVAALVFAGITRSMGRRVVREKKPVAAEAAVKTVVEAVPEAAPVGQAVSEPEPPPKEFPPLALNGILFSEEGDSYALIDGKVVREGTAVKGVTLKKVYPDKVELDFEGRRLIMRSK